MRYDIDLNWKPGKEMQLVPDALSRLLPANAPASESGPQIEIDIATVDFTMHMSTCRLNQFWPHDWIVLHLIAPVHSVFLIGK